MPSRPPPCALPSALCYALPSALCYALHCAPPCRPAPAPAPLRPFGARWRGCGCGAPPAGRWGGLPRLWGYAPWRPRPLPTGRLWAPLPSPAPIPRAPLRAVGRVSPPLCPPIGRSAGVGSPAPWCAIGAPLCPARLRPAGAGFRLCGRLFPRASPAPPPLRGGLSGGRPWGRFCPRDSARGHALRGTSGARPAPVPPTQKMFAPFGRGSRRGRNVRTHIYMFCSYGSTR